MIGIGVARAVGAWGRPLSRSPSTPKLPNKSCGCPWNTLALGSPQRLSSDHPARAKHQNWLAFSGLRGRPMNQIGW